MLKLSLPTRTEGFRSAFHSRRPTTGLLGTHCNDTRSNSWSTFRSFNDERLILIPTIQRPCLDKIEAICSPDFCFKHRTYLSSLFAAFASSLTRTSSPLNGHPTIYRSPFHRSGSAPMMRAPFSNIYRWARSTWLRSVPFHFLSTRVRSPSLPILDTTDRRPNETRSCALEINASNTIDPNADADNYVS